MTGRSTIRRWPTSNGAQRPGLATVTTGVGWLEANPSIGHCPQVTVVVPRAQATSRATLVGQLGSFETEHCVAGSIPSCRQSSRSRHGRNCGATSNPPRRPALGVSLDPNGQRASAVLSWQQDDGRVAVRLDRRRDRRPDRRAAFRGRPEATGAGLQGVATSRYDGATDAELAKYFKKPEAITGRSSPTRRPMFVNLVEGATLVWDGDDVIESDIEWTGRKTHEAAGYLDGDQAIERAPRHGDARNHPRGVAGVGAEDRTSRGCIDGTSRRLQGLARGEPGAGALVRPVQRVVRVPQPADAALDADRLAAWSCAGCRRSRTRWACRRCCAASPSSATPRASSPCRATATAHRLDRRTAPRGPSRPVAHAARLLPRLDVEHGDPRRSGVVHRVDATATGSPPRWSWCRCANSPSRRTRATGCAPCTRWGNGLTQIESTRWTPANPDGPLRPRHLPAGTGRPARAWPAAARAGPPSRCPSRRSSGPPTSTPGRLSVGHAPFRGRARGRRRDSRSRRSGRRPRRTCRWSRRAA